MPIRLLRSATGPAPNGGAGQLTVTYDLATEDSEGHGGGIAWQSVFLLNDGRICSFGTGDHGFESSNAMRIIDPVSVPGSVSASVLWPWTQDIDPPDAVTGVNRYVRNHDNHASIYIPSENKVVWAGHGVFDFGAGTPIWTYGDRTPNTDTWDDFIDISEIPLAANIYNPATVWCPQLNKGVWFGNSAGGGGQAYTQLCLIEPTGGSPAWRLNAVTIPGAQGVMRSRNESWVVGKYLYLGGNEWVGDDNTTGPAFLQKIDLESLTLVDDLSPATRDADEDFPQTVYDSARQRSIRIGIRLQEYSLATDTWTDITPVGWPGYTHPMGVYHPTMNATYFRGIPVGSGVGVVPEKFKWHRMKWS